MIKSLSGIILGWEQKSGLVTLDPKQEVEEEKV